MMQCLQIGVMCIVGAIMLPYIDCNVELTTSREGNYDKCKWSNENCNSNEECCSGTCRQLHEGTDPRCADSPLRYPCFASYQCEDGLDCGSAYSCCSPFWGVCKNVSDCCEDKYTCREEEGFTYKRCLTGSSETVFINKILLIFWLYCWVCVFITKYRCSR